MTSKGTPCLAVLLVVALVGSVVPPPAQAAQRPSTAYPLFEAQALQAAVALTAPVFSKAAKVSLLQGAAASVGAGLLIHAALASKHPWVILLTSVSGLVFGALHILGDSPESVPIPQDRVRQIFTHIETVFNLSLTHANDEQVLLLIANLMKNPGVRTGVMLDKELSAAGLPEAKQRHTAVGLLLFLLGDEDFIADLIRLRNTPFRPFIEPLSPTDLRALEPLMTHSPAFTTFIQTKAPDKTIHAATLPSLVPESAADIAPANSPESASIPQDRVREIFAHIETVFNLSPTPANNDQVLVFIDNLLNPPIAIGTMREAVILDKNFRAAGIRKALQRRAVIGLLLFLFGSEDFVVDLIRFWSKGQPGSIEKNHAAFLRPFIRSLTRDDLHALAPLMPHSAAFITFLQTKTPETTAQHAVTHEPSPVLELTDAEIDEEDSLIEESPRMVRTEARPGIPDDINQAMNRLDALAEKINFTKAGSVRLPGRPLDTLMEIARLLHLLDVQQDTFEPQFRADLAQGLKHQMKLHRPGMTKVALARAAGVADSTLSQIFAQNIPTSPAMRYKLASALNTEPELFFADRRARYQGEDPLARTEDALLRGRRLFAEYLALALRGWDLDPTEFAEICGIDTTSVNLVLTGHVDPFHGHIATFRLGSIDKIVTTLRLLPTETPTHPVWISLSELRARQAKRHFYIQLIDDLRPFVEKGEWNWQRFAKAIQKLRGRKRGERKVGAALELESLAALRGVSVENLMTAYRAMLKQTRRQITDAIERNNRMRTPMMEATNALGVTLADFSDTIFPLQRAAVLAAYLTARGVTTRFKSAWGRDDLVDVRFAPLPAKPDSPRILSNRIVRTNHRWGAPYVPLVYEAEIIANQCALETLDLEFGVFDLERLASYLTTLRDRVVRPGQTMSQTYEHAVQWFLRHTFTNASHLVLTHEQSTVNAPTPFFFHAGSARAMNARGKLLSIEVPFEAVTAIDFIGDPTIFRDYVTLQVRPGHYPIYSEADAEPADAGHPNPNVREALDPMRQVIEQEQSPRDIRTHLNIVLDLLESANAPQSVLSLVKAALRFAVRGIPREDRAGEFYRSLKDIYAMILNALPPDRANSHSLVLRSEA